jgi:hypothetical protein
MNIEKLSNNPRGIKALTGLTYAEFTNLIETFDKELKKYRNSKNKIRKTGSGKKGYLPTAKEKVFFILLYLKTYPTFDVLSFFTEKGRGRCCDEVKLYLNILEKVLKTKIQLPERKINSVEEFIQKFPEVKDVFLDATERPIQRPKSNKRNKKYYSGKKKCHTRKNVILTNEKGKILVVSPTKTGRRHDKRLADKIDLVKKIPEKVAIWADSGFQGIQENHSNSLVSKRGTKNKPLSPEEKEENKVIASFRIKIEHSIGKMKKFKAYSDKFRNKLGLFEDKIALISASLWNYHLQFN